MAAEQPALAAETPAVYSKNSWADEAPPELVLT